MNMGRLFAIIKKEFIHIKRDKASLIMAVMMPIMFIFLFGYAINTDVENIKTVVLDMDKSSKSRELIEKFRVSNYFEPNIYVKSQGEVEYYLDSGKAKAGIIIPSGFEKNMDIEGAKFQLLIDGVDPTIARTALQSGVLLSKAYDMEIKSLNSRSELNQSLYSTKVEARTRVWYNPNMESDKFTIPGLIGLILQNITVMLTAFSMVREREKGTLELIMVTPIKSAELILGKMIPYIVIGTFDFLLALFFGTFWFKVNIVGDLKLLLLLGMGFVMCSLAVGMLISTVSATQTQAMQMTMLFILPSVLLSGFVFPRDAMPIFIKLAGNLVPLTYFLNISRGIILKGVGFEYLYSDIIALGSFMTILLIMACIKFRKRLD